MEQARDDYERIFEPYEDVVKMPDFRKMLGGISEKATYTIIRSGHLQCFNIDAEYFFSKVWVIDYVLSDAYKEYKKKLKVQV